MAKAFLSHSSKDKDLVRRVANVLGNKNCVIDEISFEAGRQTLTEIFRELATSDIFVLFISNNSLQSEWVIKEIEHAGFNLTEDIIDRILPIVIDPSITYDDPRIPKWISKPYNLKYTKNEALIVKKIKQSLREVCLKNNKFNRDLEKNFVGRNAEMEHFENDINNLDGWTPTYIVAYNYFEGIGRRTFLKNALRKANYIEPYYEPVIITIDGKESLENFIYKLNTVNPDASIMEHDLSTKSMEEKVNIAKALVKEFINFREIIFIIDDGGIVLPHHEIVGWFRDLVQDEIFANNLVFCLVSRYKPNEKTLHKEHLSLVYRIPELSKSETQNLFLKLLHIHQMDNIPRNDKEFFLSKLGGIPSQINLAVFMMETDLMNARRNINDIVEYSDFYCSTLLEQVKSNPLAYQIMLLLARNEIISLSVLEKVFGEGTGTWDALQMLYDLSLYNYALGEYDYVKLNPTVADYINRSKLAMDKQYSLKLSEVMKKALAEGLDEVLANDYSEFMLTLQQMLEERKKIPAKYFMPSLILKNVIKEYDSGHYDYVISLCLDLLKNTNYDEQILWETKYRLTLAYARTKDEHFFDYIGNFDNGNKLDYYFLLGFYYRHKGESARALEYYSKVLKLAPEHSRTMREMVNIRLSLGQYDEALDLARQNYLHRKTNIYHIQSYFIALIRRRKSLTNDERCELQGLINEVERSNHTKATDVCRCMQGEYAYYVKHKLDKSIFILKDALNINENKMYPKKSLLEIYRRQGMTAAAKELELLKVDE